MFAYLRTEEVLRISLELTTIETRSNFSESLVEKMAGSFLLRICSKVNTDAARMLSHLQCMS